MRQDFVPESDFAARHAASLTGAWWAVFVLTVLYTSSFVDRTILGLLVAPIRRDLGISDTDLSLLQGFSFAIFYTFLGLPAGRLADRGNRKNIVSWGAGLWSIATAICGFTQSFWQLFLARIGVGVGEAALTPSAHSLMSDLFPVAQRGRAFSVYHMGVAMGQGVALLIGGTVIRAVASADTIVVPLLGVTRSWQAVFLMVGVPGLFLVLLARTLREPLRAMGRAEVPSLREAFAFIGAHKKTFGLWMTGNAFYAIVLFGYPAWMPTVFIRKFGMAAGDVGQIYGLIVLVGGATGMIVAGMLCDWLLSRGDENAYWKVVTYIGVIALPAAVAAPLMPTKELAFLVLIVEVMCMQGFTGVASAALMTATPPRLRGQITAVHFFFAALTGFGIGPTFIAVFTDFVYRSDADVGLSVATASAITLPIAILFFGLSRRPLAATIRDVAAINAAAGVR